MSDPVQAEALSRAAASAGRPLRLHLKVDTGMGRVGVSPRAFARQPTASPRLPAVRLAGLMTHFAESDAADPGFTEEQLARFARATDDLRAAGVAIPIRHAANSAALFHHPDARLDMVRPGIMLYGCHPCDRRARTTRHSCPRSGSGRWSAT